jgi:hypothetical protein
MSKIKNCPFCGEKPKLEEHRTNWSVTCECGVTMLGEHALEPKGIDWEYFKLTAIGAWNRREQGEGENYLLHPDQNKIY